MNEKLIQNCRSCEICGKEGVDELINIGIKFGYELGDFGQSFSVEYKMKPKMIGVYSIYLCKDCKYRIRKNKFFNVNIMPQIKELIKKDWVKNMILKELEEKH